MSTNPVDENPYAAPALHEIPTPEQLPTNLKGLRIRWCVMVAVNVPLPAFFGLQATSGAGRIGMPIGIVFVAVIGLALCPRFPRVMSNLCRGAVLTAFSQFYPVMHMFIGIMAIGICHNIPGYDGNMSGVFQITMATLITGAGLILASLIVGTIFTLIIEYFSPKARRLRRRSRRREHAWETDE